jgi:hypothetical protein
MWATSRYPVYVPACRPRLINGRAKGPPKLRPDGTQFVLLRTSSFQQHRHQLLPTRNTSSSPDGAFHAGRKCDIPGPCRPGKRNGTLLRVESGVCGISLKNGKFRRVIPDGAGQLKTAAGVGSLRAQPYQWLCLRSWCSDQTSARAVATTRLGVGADSRHSGDSN